ncbi:MULTISPECIES: VOC family protein [unclassified Streptomyces]|uniref:VOC family protein n=1 Tax=unclassified Streptomyces TaxID=2593676 RepID=UPI002E2BA1ED|nr:VOC family protein [Streptomyces sp. NBC_00690]
MTIATLRAVVLDCPDPIALAHFYQQVLGGEVTPDGYDWVDLVSPSGTTLAFQLAPGHTPPVWPSVQGAQQFHLDFTVTDLDAAEREVLALGAKVLEMDEERRSWRVYADPAGHPFCLCID